VGSWETGFGEDQLWPREVSNADQKREVARKMAERVRSGDVVGVGSGSTSLFTLKALADRAASESIDWVAVTTSDEMELTCASLGVPTTSLQVVRPDWSFDGADEVDPSGNLIKGRGGAMLREKLVMASSPERYVVVDSAKLVDRLGSKFPVPLEVVPEAVRLVHDELRGWNVGEIGLRAGVSKDGPVITEHGNYVLDVRMLEIEEDAEKRLKAIPGVVECGLFIGYAPTVLVSQ